MHQQTTTRLTNYNEESNPAREVLEQLRYNIKCSKCAGKVKKGDKCPPLPHEELRVFLSSHGILYFFKSFSRPQEYSLHEVTERAN